MDQTEHTYASYSNHLAAVLKRWSTSADVLQLKLNINQASMLPGIGQFELVENHVDNLYWGSITFIAIKLCTETFNQEMSC